MDYRKIKLKLDHNKISGDYLEMTCIDNIYKIRKIKLVMRLNSPFLMSNILKILLYYDEIDLACYLTSFYQI
jgi:hypothetical protein